MTPKVVVTGMNIISSLGLDLESSWEGLVQGRSGVTRISSFDPAENETQIAAQLPIGFDEYSQQYVRKRTASQMTRVTRMGYVCAKVAVEKSGIDFETFDKTRCAVILGVVHTANSSLEKKKDPRNAILKSMNNSMSAWISLEYKLLGPNYTVSCACASSAYAMALGYDLIKTGKADAVITGGADSIVNPEEITGFNELFALSVDNEHPATASRPFSKDRDGFVIGEGAGMIILESEASARKRGAKIYAEMVDYALTSEAYNIMSPMLGGEGIAHTMRTALQNGSIDPKEVDYINAHGTSTTLNDLYETLAIKKVFGERAYDIPVSSSKSMIGHTVGAAGAIEAAIAIQSIIHSVITPTINLHPPDPELDLDYVPNVARYMEVKCAISNSFAFGGHNATLIFRKI